MAQSLSKIYIHLVFHIKNISVKIRDENKKDLFAYMGSVIKDNESIPIMINGTNDHVHLLFVLSKNKALSKIVEEIKRHSSRWIKTKSANYKNFGWQAGYAAFYVSQSLHEKTKSYILNQEKRHKKMTYNEELILFLKEYGIDFKEDYLFND